MADGSIVKGTMAADGSLNQIHLETTNGVESQPEDITCVMSRTNALLEAERSLCSGLFGGSIRMILNDIAYYRKLHSNDWRFGKEQKLPPPRFDLSTLFFIVAISQRITTVTQLLMQLNRCRPASHSPTTLQTPKQLLIAPNIRSVFQQLSKVSHRDSRSAIDLYLTRHHNLLSAKAQEKEEFKLLGSVPCSTPSLQVAVEAAGLTGGWQLCLWYVLQSEGGSTFMQTLQIAVGSLMVFDASRKIVSEDTLTEKDSKSAANLFVKALTELMKLEIKADRDSLVSSPHTTADDLLAVTSCAELFAKKSDKKLAANGRGAVDCHHCGRVSDLMRGSGKGTMISPMERAELIATLATFQVVVSVGWATQVWDNKPDRCEICTDVVDALRTLVKCKNFTSRARNQSTTRSANDRRIMETKESRVELETALQQALRHFALVYSNLLPWMNGYLRISSLETKTEADWESTSPSNPVVRRPTWMVSAVNYAQFFVRNFSVSTNKESRHYFSTINGHNKTTAENANSTEKKHPSASERIIPHIARYHQIPIIDHVRTLAAVNKNHLNNPNAHFMLAQTRVYSSALGGRFESSAMIRLMHLESVDLFSRIMLTVLAEAQALNVKALKVRENAGDRDLIPLKYIAPVANVVSNEIHFFDEITQIITTYCDSVKQRLSGNGRHWQSK
eukprot:GILI01015948.1.p1 GENE.GILI01015948.1~~GILI01015948.1.p1  ORF type:complete len:785 (+),score=46.35 GILI01015948.1:330-2357(+)